MPFSHIASDYAVITSENLEAYYGYEETTLEDEWCFVAKVQNVEIVRIPWSQLGVRDKYDCANCLLAGLARLFDRVELHK